MMDLSPSPAETDKTWRLRAREIAATSFAARSTAPWGA
jgi:hypothetical protein